MNYTLEENVKAQLYKEYQQEKYKKGMDQASFQKYIENMIKYVEENFRLRCKQK